jgi:protein involved in polysaccharide export with SLBB domain
MVYQADRPVSLLEVLAEAGGLANDAGDTVIVNRPAQEVPSDPTEPPAIGAEDPAPAAVSNGSTHTRPAQESPSSTASASSASANSPPPIDPPHLNNIITINLNELMESGDATNNIILQAGDIVTVPHSGIVYVLGAVSRPGGFVLANDRGQMTTLKVLSLAGGLSTTAKSDHAVIVRKDSQGQQHEVAVDLKKVMKRQSEDVQLQPSDILYVPSSPGKQAMLRALEFGIALGSGVALYRVAYH